VLWDASTSTDADGTIVQYDWDMDNDSVSRSSTAQQQFVTLSNDASLPSACG